MYRNMACHESQHVAAAFAGNDACWLQVTPFSFAEASTDAVSLLIRFIFGYTQINPADAYWTGLLDVEYGAFDTNANCDQEEEKSQGDYLVAVPLKKLLECRRFPSLMDVLGKIMAVEHY